MRIRTRRPEATLSDRAVWQAVSLLLAYPDHGHDERIQTVTELLAYIDDPARAQLQSALEQLPADRRQAAEEYVETFDLGRRTTLYLTYWTAGDTRNRGAAMHEFASAYRSAGVAPPKDEAPDHLPVLLEFAATVAPDIGRRLLLAHRAPITVIAEALRSRRSPYAAAFDALRSTLPGSSEEDTHRVRRLQESGPPTESVGLQPFTLTVPPRRSEGVG